MKCDKKTVLLYAVTDKAWANEETFLEQIEEALKGGVTCLQLREKHLNEDEFLKEAFEVKKLCKRYGVAFFVNDNVDVAIKCGADGIHVGQSDMRASDVRARIGEKMMLGVSVSNIAEALEAVQNGADMLGVGAIFSTTTKEDAEIVSIKTLSAICRAVDVPVVAIGGLNKATIPKLRGTGIDGVALVSAIFSAPDIASSTRELLQLTKTILSN